MSLASVLASLAPVVDLRASTGLYTDTAHTTPSTAVNDAIACVTDNSGNAIHATQGTSGARPLRKLDGNGKTCLLFDGSDDFFTLGQPALLDTLQDGSYEMVSVVKLSTLTYGFICIHNRHGASDGRIMHFMNAQVSRDGLQHRYNGLTGDRIAPVTNAAHSVGLSFAKSSANNGTETLYYDGRPDGARTGAVPSVNTSIDWNLMAGNAGANWQTPAYWYATWIFDHVLTQSERDSLQSAVDTDLLGEARSKRTVVLEGDSIMLGYGTSSGIEMGRYVCDQLVNTGVSVFQPAVSSSTTTIVAARLSGITYPKLDTTRNDYVVLWVGTNNIYLSGRTGAETYSDIVSLCNTIRTDKPGVKIIVCTMLPRDPGGAADANRNALNSALDADFTVATTNAYVFKAAGSTTYADYEVRMQNVSGIGADGDNLGANYLDGIHPNDAGSLLAAVPLAAAIDIGLDAPLTSIPVIMYHRRQQCIA